VRRVEGTGARIFDTRKTIPGFRSLAKYAVRSGGGVNLRSGLYDAILIKENHLVGVPLRELASHLTAVAAQSKAEDPRRLIQVEVENLDQLREIVKVDAVDVVLLDNMDCPRMQSAVELRNSVGKKGKLALEASGGVTLETVRSIALTGVERISVGAITHSAAALDIGLDVETA
jgi:nicotinate-nucleotide pyrophosphorylase (carboxylating)